MEIHNFAIITTEHFYEYTNQHHSCMRNYCIYKLHLWIKTLGSKQEHLRIGVDVKFVANTGKGSACRSNDFIPAAKTALY